MGDAQYRQGKMEKSATLQEGRIDLDDAGDLTGDTIGANDASDAAAGRTRDRDPGGWHGKIVRR